MRSTAPSTACWLLTSTFLNLVVVPVLFARWGADPKPEPEPEEA
jgi:hypothetical protein